MMQKAICIREVDCERMVKMKEKICTVIGLIGSFVASLLGGWDAGLKTLILFMGIDYVSGFLVAGVFLTATKQVREHWKALLGGKVFAGKAWFCCLY